MKYETYLKVIFFQLIKLCTDIQPYIFAGLKLYCTWNNLSKLWNECHKKLEDSLQMALHYQDTMQVCVQVQYKTIYMVCIHL